MTEQSVIDTSLRIVKHISASVEDVYQAWTDAEQVKQWMGPGQVKCETVDIDLKVGGQYSIAMITAEGEHPNAIGEYKEIIPNEKLVFTWTWKGGEMPDTLVTLDFKAKYGGTELTLLHEQFPAKEAAEKHNQGWEGCLAGLEEFLK